MDIYLPIAGPSVNALLIVILGGLVGLLSGMFGTESIAAPVRLILKAALSTRKNRGR